MSFLPQRFASSAYTAGGATRISPLRGNQAILVALVAIHLCLLPWALGGMHAWTQVSSLALSVVTFTLAIAGPRDSEDGPGTPHRLLRFPMFWAGLALVAFVAVQGLNPSMRFTRNADSWWLVQVPSIDWLPSGIDGPFSRSNPWRAIVVYASCWLLACSVWAGFTRRQSFRVLFVCLALNAFLLAAFGLFEQLFPSKLIFWSIRPGSETFIASFIYRNHAGAYFDLMASLLAGLAIWHFDRERRRLERNGISVVFTFMAAIVWVMVLFSYSRMSIVILVTLTGAIACVLTLRLIARPEGERRSVQVIPAAVAVLALIAICAVTVSSGKVWKRFAEAVGDPVASFQDRKAVRMASSEMLHARLLLGWGAGSFRYAFPIYAQKYPGIYYSSDGRIRYWEHAHDDFMEFAVELGMAGLAPLVFGLCYFACLTVRARFWRNSISMCSVLGCALALVHGCVDFIFQNPAVLLTWCVILVSAIRWAQLDQPLAKRGPLRA